MDCLHPPGRSSYSNNMRCRKYFARPLKGVLFHTVYNYQNKLPFVGKNLCHFVQIWFDAHFKHPVYPFG